MCTAIFAYGVHPTLLFLLAFNRDEFFDRKTGGVHAWPDFPQVLGPRDLERQGTWLGVSRTGRVAFLTNIRVPDPIRSPKSRGMLPVDFVTGNRDPTDFLKGLDMRDYSPLNLVCGELFGDAELAIYNSRTGNCTKLEKGIHGVSNGRFDDPKWHKVLRGKTKMQEILKETGEGLDQRQLPWEEIFDKVLGHSEEVPPGTPLPNTGIAKWREQKFSAMRIAPFWNFANPGGLYGTRSQIVLAVWSDRTVEIRERVWDLDQNVCEERRRFDAEI